MKSVLKGLSSRESLPLERGSNLESPALQYGRLEFNSMRDSQLSSRSSRNTGYRKCVKFIMQSIMKFIMKRVASC